MKSSLDHQLIRYNYAVFLLPFLIALIARYLYHLLAIPDFIGDAYHNWYISLSTIQNSWEYSDYKGRELVWLPAHRYLNAFFMDLFGAYNMATAHVVNTILGAITCGFTALLTSHLTNKRLGLIAGILLAFTPSHIIYSHINTPEILAALILLLAVYVHLKEKPIWLIPLAFVGVLTKNELTMLLGIFGLLLLLGKNWRSAGFLLTGAVFGLTIWAWWCFTKTGSPIFWITERTAGSRWDYIFQLADGGHSVRPIKFVSYLIRAFPFVILIPIAIVSFWSYFKFSLQQKDLRLIVLIVLINWLFLLSMQFYFFPQLSVRYFLYTLPIGIVMFISWANYLNESRKKLFLKVIAITCLAALILQLTNSYTKRYSYAPYREIGKYIEENLPSTSNYWMDFPTTIYYSGLPLSSVYSGRQMISYGDAKQNRDSTLMIALTENRIRYVMSAPVSYSLLHSIWPAMKKPESFQWKGFLFSPIFTYEPTEYLIDEKNWWDRMRNDITSRQNVAILWEVNKSKKFPSVK